jgi:DNA polymerase-3 subunit epsilon
MTNEQWERDRQESIEWARALLDCDDWALLDTETTGLGPDAEIIQIGIIDRTGTRLADNILMRPWLRGLCEGKRLIIYNADYDTRLINQTCRLWGLPTFQTKAECAMLRYAAFHGEWDEYHDHYRWVKLTGGDHSAVGDCIATLDLIRRMAGTVSPVELAEIPTLDQSSTTVSDYLDHLYEKQQQMAALRETYNQRHAAIMAKVASELTALDDEIRPLMDDMMNQISIMSDTIKTTTLKRRKTFKGSHLQAMFVNGRVTWDTRALDGYTAAHPELNTFRKVSEPSVRITEF